MAKFQTPLIAIPQKDWRRL